MVCWFDGPLAAFAVRATGCDAERDRIVSAAVVAQREPGAPLAVRRWLVSPGVPVPEGAAPAGLTGEQVLRRGRWPAPVVEEVAARLAELGASGRPLAVLDAPFGLTLLDRETRRHRASPLAAYLAGAPLYVLDPLLLDRHLDRPRKGRRAAPALWPLYGVRPPARSAAGEARAALDLVRAVGRRFAGRLARLEPPELHALQRGWCGERAARPWFALPGAGRAAEPVWPLRPVLPAAV
ncbi:3'-5' exonuclease [Streptomyces sp. NPDC050560]|uniref:3'-5' exonuclease n=1 Tax=Streptomyces sp. NPDC050560 TaxID=3365630 RepID=UPI0037B2A2A2